MSANETPVKNMLLYWPTNKDILKSHKNAIFQCVTNVLETLLMCFVHIFIRINLCDYISIEVRMRKTMRKTLMS